MASFADASCVLRVNARCPACKMNVMEILSSISGVYSVDIDAERGLVKVSGEVEPSILLGALMRSGRHAEIVTANIRHPAISRRAAYYDDYASSGNGSYDYSLPCCGSFNDPHRHGRFMSSRSHHYPLMGSSPWHSSNYRYAPLPLAGYAPGYSVPAYDYDCFRYLG